MNKYILTEFLELDNDSSLLTEDEKRMNESGQELILAGRLQKADSKNGNGRIYPKKILMREVENYRKMVQEKRALGELDHPDSSVIELKNASHLISFIEMRGDEVVGKIKILDTPSGKIAKDLIHGGVKLGVSSRGLGSTKEQNGDTIVQDDFQLICFDLVSEPSTTGAFLFKEHKEPNIFTKSDKIFRALNDILNKDN